MRARSTGLVPVCGAVVVAVACAAAGAACSSRAPAWHVERGFLRAPDGRAAILRGVNLSGSQKVSPYLDDKTAADYERVRSDWGMNSLRFVMTWSAVEPSSGVVERMAWAQSYGLSVVLDMHEDVYGEGFGFDGAPKWSCDASRYAAFVPQMPWFLSTTDPNVEACVDDFYTRSDLQDAFVAAWRHVAERLARSPAVVGFDVLNEPEWGSYAIFGFEADRLTPMYERVVAAVRAAAPGWVAFLEPSSARNAGIATSLSAFDFPDVVYAPHSYDSSAEGGGGFDPSHRGMILDNVAKLAVEAQTLGAALWIGEYGGMDSAPGIVPYMTAQYDAAGAAAAGSAYWAYDKSDGYGLVNPDGSEKPDLIGAVARPYPARIAGDPMSYAFDATTSTFTTTYVPNGSGATEIIVPARVYPGGYTVDCGGCAWSTEGDEVVITKAAAVGASVTVTIHP